MPNSIRLLLVEDDELFRLGLVVRLQQEPTLKIVAEAEDGETAVDLANRHSLDLVLLDVGLPRMSGLEACRQIKLQHPNLPIYSWDRRFILPDQAFSFNRTRTRNLNPNGRWK
jgi:two-component system NarL family response regulator